MSSTPSLRRTSLGVNVLTSISTLLTLIFAILTTHHPAQKPSEIFTLIATALASTSIILTALLSLISPSTYQTPTFIFATAPLNTTFTACLIAVAYLHHSSALLPCTAGQTGNSTNGSYVTACQLRQAEFWCAVLAAVGFAALVGVGGVVGRRVRKERAAAGDRDGGEGLGDGGKDVEGEEEWRERMERGQ